MKSPNVRPLAAFGALLLLVSQPIRPAAVATFEVTGTVRIGDHPEPDAVVWLDGAASNAPTGLQPQQKKVVLDQRNLSFAPHVLIIQVGTAVTFPNNDRVFHNVFSFHNGKRFDLGLYPIGTARQVRFDQPGLSRIFCNIHPGMAAYIMAVNTPYFSSSDKNGRFSIPAVLPGSYTYNGWRPGAETVSGSAELVQGNSLDISWP